MPRTAMSHRSSPYPEGREVASLETLSCDAGWRPWLFVRRRPTTALSAGRR